MNADFFTGFSFNTLKDINYNEDLPLEHLEHQICRVWELVQKLKEPQLQGNETNSALALNTINLLIRWGYDAEDLVLKKRVEGKTSIPKQKLKEIWNKLIKKQDISRVIHQIEKFLNTVSGICDQSQTTLKQCNATSGRSGVGGDTLIGRECDINEILQKLSSCDGHAEFGVSIVGMCGVGKSLLAETIFNKQEIADEYPQKIWHEVKDGKFDLAVVEKKIYQGLKSSNTLFNKKSLIVFDNLQQVGYEEWNKFENFKKAKFENVRVIVTTQNQGISNKTCFKRHEVGLLLDEFCEKVIKKYAGYNKVVSSAEARDLDAIIERSIHKCEGIPSVARWIGIFIGQKSKDDLENSIGREGRLSEMIEFKRSEIFPKLMSNYIGIKPELWRCLAYFSLLPVSHKFSIDDLVHLWVGECFIKQPEGTKTLEHIKMDYVNDLQERSILQSSGKLNSFGQDFATLAASGTCLQLGQGSTSIKTAFNERTRHLSIPSKDFNNENWTELQKIKKLRTVLALYDDNNDDDRNAARLLQKVQLVFSKEISGLRVLSLYKTNISEIPSSIGKLKLLRYFDISFTPVKIFPTELKTIHELQFLKFKGTEISDLRRKLHTLKNLVYVDWDVNSIRKLEGLYRIGKLSKLENLPLFKVDNKEGYLISELEEMNKLQGSLHIQNLENVTNIREAEKAKLDMKPGLVKIGLEWNSISSKSDVAENVLKSLNPHKILKELELIQYGGEKFPDWIKDSYLEKIHLKKCGLCPFFQVLGKLEYLKVLVLEDMESITELSCHSSGDTQAGDPLFSALESLEMVNMTQLQKVKGLQASDMPNLSKFKAFGCIQIAAVFTSEPPSADVYDPKCEDDELKFKSIFENKALQHNLEIMIDGVVLSLTGQWKSEEVESNNSQKITTLVHANKDKEKRHLIIKIDGNDELEAPADSRWKVDGDDELEHLPIDLKRPNSSSNETWLELLRDAQAQKARSSSAQSSSIFPLTWKTFKGAESFEGISNDEVHKVKLYFGLFTSDYEFEKDTIVQLWMATGLFHELSEHVGYLCFNRLLKEEFIIKSRTDILREIDKYKVNDVNKVTTFADLGESKRHYAMRDDNNGLSAVHMFTCWHVSVMTKSIDPEIFKDNQQGKESELRSFLLICDYGSTLKHIPYSFFKIHLSMQALDLSGSHISELPSSLGNMKQLRFLGLSFTLIQSIPESIAHLQELQTLKLEGCKYLHMLPDGMKQLTNLQYLDFDVLGQLNFMPQGMGSLTKLRTLSAFIVGGEGCSLRELKNLNNIRGSFCISGLEYASIEDAKEAAMPEKKCLTGLHLKWNGSISYDKSSKDEASSILKNLEPTIIESVKELQISYYPSDKFPELIQSGKGFERVVKVTLLRCENKEFIDLNNLSSLKHLHITDMDEVATIDLEVANIDHEVPKFPNLETLVIDGMYKLEGWTGIKLNDCQRLKKLRVRHCPKLTKLDFLPFLGSLKYLEISHCESFESLPNHHPLPASLETLIIDNCPLLKERCSKGGNDWEKIKHLPYISVDTEDIGSANKEANLKESEVDDEDEDEKENENEEFSTVVEGEENIVNHSEGNFKESKEDEAGSSTMVRGEEGTSTMVGGEEDVLYHSGATQILPRHKRYCSLFPNDYEFERDTLVQSWMAIGLYHVPLEDFGYSCFDRLVEEGFIIKSGTDILTGIEKYKIDVEQATTLLNQDDSKGRYALSDDNELTGVDKSKCRHLSIASKSISPITFRTLEGISELRTVLLIPDYGDSLKQIDSSFFEALTCMRALDLSGSHISELPSSIENMSQLHFLDLSFTLIDTIPESIAGLGKLQTLKLKGCKRLHTLPKGMKQLSSLRHLDFDILGQLTSMPKGMGQLIELRTLHAFIVSEEDGCSITELENLNWLRGSFCISGLEYASGDDAKVAVIVKKEHLTKLHLKWKDSKAYDDSARNKASSTLKFLRPYESLQHLKVSYYPGSDWPDWIEALKNLVSVTLLRCENKKISGLSNLPNLKHLTLIDINNVTSIDIMSRSLETLTIDGMKKLLFLRTGYITTFDSSLEEMRVKHCPKLESHSLSFSKLKYLEISHCKSWERMCYGLPESLNTLVINNCPLLKTRCSGENGGDWFRIRHVPNIWIDMKGFGEENKQTADPDDSDSSDIETDHSDDSNDSDKETDHLDESNDPDTEADRSDDSNDSDSEHYL